MANTDKTRRVQMELSPRSFERLDKLKDLVEASSYTEIVKDAFRLHEPFVEKDSEGSSFLSSIKTSRRG
jgi:hypothetical protein